MFSKDLRFPFALEFESEEPNDNSVTKQSPNYHSSVWIMTIKCPNGNLVTKQSPNCHLAIQTRGLRCFQFFWEFPSTDHKPVADLGSLAPPMSPFFSFSCSFQLNLCQIISDRSLPLGLARPLGNPGSTTANYGQRQYGQGRMM